MIAIADVETNILNKAMEYLTEKQYGLGKDAKALKKELKKRFLVKIVIDSCSSDKLNNDLRLLIETYN